MNKTDTVLRKLANSWKRKLSWLTNKNILYTNHAMHGSARKTWRGRVTCMQEKWESGKTSEQYTVFLSVSGQGRKGVLFRA